VHRTSAARTYAVRVVTTRDDLAALAPELDALALESIEPNVFYESWMLQAGLVRLPAAAARIAVVRHQSGALVGLFPFELIRRFQGLPLPALRLWRHDYCFLCTPLVHRAHAEPTVQALLDWVESGGSPARFLDLDLVTSAAPFADLLTRELGRRPAWVQYRRTYQRAMFLADSDSRAGISAKHRKEMRRLERRLAEAGRVAYRVAAPDEPVEPWLEAFLALEASGWKGRAGTALASVSHTRQFFLDIATEAARRRRLQLLALELDGAPIAMKCNLLAGNGAFAFKIAFDDRFARYSPGMLLELFTMRHLATAHPEIRWMDSCADRSHFMINRLWRGRRDMGTIWIAPGGVAGLMLRCWPHYHRLSRLVRRLRQRAA